MRTRTSSRGHRAEAQFPLEANATTCYGPKLQGFRVYLLHRYHLPLPDTAKLMTDTCGALVSAGCLDSLGSRTKVLLEPFLETLRHWLLPNPVAYFDETVARVDGKFRWVHVACTPEFTLLHLAPSRSIESMRSGGFLAHGFNGVAIHNGLSAYQKFPRQQGLCNIHHLHELSGIAEAGNQQRATKLAQLLVEILMPVNDAIDTGKTM